MKERTPANTPAMVRSIPSWRRYPHLQAAIETDTATVVAEMEQTRTEIERSTPTGSAREQDRARMALIAYDRALDLYQHLVDRRDELLQGLSNMRSGTSINE